MARNQRTSQPGRSRRGGGRSTSDGEAADHEENSEVAQIQLLDEVPEAPGTLLAEGKARWIQVCTLLIHRGMLHFHFMPSIEHLCRNYDQLSAIDKAIDGKYMIAGPRGRTMANPLLATRTQISILVRSLLNDFGLNPAAMRLIGHKTTTSASTGPKATPRRPRDADPFPE